ncbi:hypothetical protein QQS21_007540 [Conoideocrella luteorostrata]|uniref:Acetylxylan esterase n=1 Tax=Conoideocrella luteorostrata TaxID=1105319 RepID=A0AAJ0CNC8_9HYPO|nr:hypothetical protein QQS21_007540 [Conoideocrella luteorostrata]
MHYTAFFLAAASPLAAAAAAAAVLGRRADCAPTHLLVARGSNERPGYGILQSLASSIVEANDGATMEPINYPAKLRPYGPSVSAGVDAVKKQLSDYVQACPDAKILLLGYSQGANIIGDALCGGNTGGQGPDTDPIGGDISSHVAAVVWYGDPRHNAGKSFDKGTAQTDGINARTDNQSCDAFASVIASYCDIGDPFCAGGNDVGVHFGYPRKYDGDATEFVT